MTQPPNRRSPTLAARLAASLVALASASLSVVACGAVVQFTPTSDDPDECAELACGDPCGDGAGTCTSEGTCSFDDVACPASCVLGTCGDPCSICDESGCQDALCNEEGDCVLGGVVCAF